MFLDALRIVAESWPIAFMFIGLGLGVVIIVVRALARTDPLKHQETMTQIETRHRETMLEINRRDPKMIDAKPKKEPY